MTIAATIPTESPEPGPPRLLVDTNVFRDLADRKLTAYEAPLLEIARHRSPPLLWTCPIVFEEIACHIRAQEADRFEHFRDALRWMEQLCGNHGMAEDLPWVLRAGVFERRLPYDGELATAVNRIRRQVIKMKRFADVPADLLVVVDKTRRQARGLLDSWTEHRERMQPLAREKPNPGETRHDGATVASNAIFEVSRKRAAEDAPLWGPFRPEAEQRREQREMAAFELAQLMNARNPQPYNVKKHEGDYNDGWLLAYCAVGYRLVTGDARISSALKTGECKDPRVSGVAEAIRIAEAWLASKQ